MSNLRFKEQSTTPADASAGQVQMYAKTDGKLYAKRGGDAETRISDSSTSCKVLVESLNLLVYNSVINYSAVYGSKLATTQPVVFIKKMVHHFEKIMLVLVMIMMEIEMHLYLHSHMIAGS